MSIPKATLERFYRKGWERRWLQQLDGAFVPVNLGFRFRLTKTLALIARRAHESFRVLDLGCGVGIYDVNLLRRFPNATLYGVDLAETQLEAARTLARTAGVDARATFVADDVSAFTPPGDFDVVLSTEVIAHLPDPGPCLDTLRSAARSTAQILVSVPLRDRAQQSFVYHRQETGAPGAAVESQDLSVLDPGRDVFSYYYRLYSFPEAVQLMATHGFRVCRARRSHFMLRESRRHPVKRAANSLNVRLKAGWLDSALIGTFGDRHAETLILDCRRAAGAAGAPGRHAG